MLHPCLHKETGPQASTQQLLTQTIATQGQLKKLVAEAADLIAQTKRLTDELQRRLVPRSEGQELSSQVPGDWPALNQPSAVQHGTGYFGKKNKPAGGPSRLPVQRRWECVCIQTLPRQICRQPWQSYLRLNLSCGNAITQRD